MTRGRFAAALPLLLLPWFLGAPPRPALAQVKGKTELEKLQRDLKDRRFTVVAVNNKDTKEEVGPWIQSRGLSPVVLLGTSGVVADIYRVRSPPTAYLIGRDHKLVWRVQGTRGWDERPTRERIDYLLKVPAR